jgi:hypothetical protein
MNQAFQDGSSVDHSNRSFAKPASTIAQFCAEHGNISKSFFHKLVNEGKGPRLMKIGRRTLISAEAAAEWRAQMETQTNQTSVEV